MYIKNSELTILFKFLVNSDIKKILSYKLNNFDSPDTPHHEEIKKYYFKNLKLAKNYNSNFINKFIFVVNNKQKFIDSLKDFKVNGGPRNFRHELNSLHSKLATVDYAFRKSLAFSLSPYLSRLALRHDNFSSNNIHRNLGYFRYYSK